MVATQTAEALFESAFAGSLRNPVSGKRGEKASFIKGISCALKHDKDCLRAVSICTA